MSKKNIEVKVQEMAEKEAKKIVDQVFADSEVEDEAEETTAGGIVLPDSVREKPQEGKILSVGNGQMTESGQRSPLQISEGDRVLFSSYAGTEIEVDGKQLLIMSESDILAVVG